MRKSLAERLARNELVPRLGRDYVATGYLVHRVPVEWLLHGFIFENAGHPGGTDFFLWAFVQPMFTPSERITLDIGERLGGGHWTLADHHVPSELIDLAATRGRELLDALAEPIDLAFHLEQEVLAAAPRNALLREDAAYSRALAGDVDGALQHLAKVESAYDGRQPFDWERGLLDRVERFRSALQESEAAARVLLKQYRDRTVAALGVAETSQGPYPHGSSAPRP